MCPECRKETAVPAGGVKDFINCLMDEFILKCKVEEKKMQSVTIARKMIVLSPTVPTAAHSYARCVMRLTRGIRDHVAIA